MDLGNTIIDLKMITKVYGKIDALSEIDMIVNKGDIYGLLGPNGSGKSTTMKIICGLLPFDSGSCEIFNLDIKTNKKFIQKRIGLVTQEYSIYEDLKARENIEFFGRLYGLKGEKLKKQIKYALNMVDLDELADSYPTTFSGGMKRRLNIACALVHLPDILIMDEPTASLDPISREYILKSIKKINEIGTTIVYTSHYLDEIEKLCNKATIINKGKVVAQGKTEEIRRILNFKNIIVIDISGVKQIYWNDILRIEDIIFQKNSVKTIECKRQDILSYTKNYHIEISCDNSSRVLERLIPYFKDRLIHINNIEINKNSLEDVFLKVIE